MKESKIGELVGHLLEGVSGLSKNETIVGEAQRAGEGIVIPVHRLKIAFGVGSVNAGAHGSKVGADTGAEGVGGAIELDPVAAIAVSKDGQAQLLTVDADSSGTWSQLLKDVPDLVAKVAEAFGERVTLELKSRGRAAEPALGGEAEGEKRLSGGSPGDSKS
jgi:uncharacterized spore protein YtfJ